MFSYFSIRQNCIYFTGGWWRRVILQVSTRSNESVNLFPLVSKKLEEAGTGRIGLDER